MPPTKRALMYDIRPSIALLVQVAEATDEEWGKYVDELDAEGRKGLRSLLVVADGPGPTGPQRRKLKTAALPPDFRTAVVSASSVARVITSVIGWVHPNMFAFAPAEMDQAFTVLNVPADLRPELTARIAAMRAELVGGAA